MAKFHLVHQLVRRIPTGRVTTYGCLARALTAGGAPMSARAAGWAMRGSPEGVPWHRVVNASGELSAELRGNCPAGLQRALLEAERVEFDEAGRVLLAAHRWDPGC